jgi:hypothetical protein
MIAGAFDDRDSAGVAHRKALPHPSRGEEVPAGKVRLMEVKARDDRSIDMWFGNVQRDGLYINMQSPQRELIIEAARALEPIG